MIALLSLLFGVQDIVTLVSIMAINACMNLFGLLFEVMNSYLRDAGSNEVDWSAFIYGSFAGVVPWAILFTIVLTSVNFSDIPLFAWGLMFSYLFMFNTFPINMYLQYA